MLEDKHRSDVLHARGITDEVIDYAVDGRQRYTSVSSYDDLRNAHSHPERFHGLLLAQSTAIVVNRWDLAQNRLPSYLRFDKKVRTDPRKKPTGYVYPTKEVVGEDYVKVIDVHPLAVELLTADPTPPVFFCLEGSLKADAVLSAGRAAVSVASVTLWEVSEDHLAPYLPHFRQAPCVFVIPDSDYNYKGFLSDGKPDLINWQVRLQTDYAVSWLRKHGVETAYMVPPYLSWQDSKRFSHLERWKIGIDDHLAIGGNLRPWSSENPRGVQIWKPRPRTMPLEPLPRERKDRTLRRDEEFVRWLTEKHGEHGLFAVREARADLGWGINRVSRTMHSLEERRIFSYWEGKPEQDENTGDWFTLPHVYGFNFSLSRERPFEAGASIPRELRQSRSKQIVQ